MEKKWYNKEDRYSTFKQKKKAWPHKETKKNQQAIFSAKVLSKCGFYRPRPSTDPLVVSCAYCSLEIKDFGEHGNPLVYHNHFKPCFYSRLFRYLHGDSIDPYSVAFQQDMKSTFIDWPHQVDNLSPDRVQGSHVDGSSGINCSSN